MNENGATAPAPHTTVAVIGAGFSGLTTAIRLVRAGIHDFVVLERGDRVGGTWRDTRYPGVEVDVPSLLYSLSDAPNPEWTRVNCRGPEIQRYLEDLVARFDLGSHLRFRTTVTGLTFDERDGMWRVATNNGAVVLARAVVAADGLLAEPKFPDIPGIDDFRGRTMHSAAWDHDYDFTGKRVGVFGSGASAVQIIPELVTTVDRLTVFQRTPGWVLPRSGRDIPESVRTLFRRHPAVQRAVRTALFLGYEAAASALVWNTPLTRALEQLARLHLRRQVSDRQLRAQLTPDYRIGCKRPLLSSTFYPAIQRHNCRLVTHAIARISPTGVRAADGSEHRLDCLVFATGYDSRRSGRGFTITGIDGRVLADVWAGGMVGYKSVSISGFPNLFFTMGPNSFGHSSELLFIEAQVDYAVLGIQELLSRDLRILDVKPDAQQQHNTDLQRRLRGTTFNSGCHSWFLTDGGYNGMTFPGTVTAYRRALRRFDCRHYRMVEGFSISTLTRGEIVDTPNPTAIARAEGAKR